MKIPNSKFYQDPEFFENDLKKINSKDLKGITEAIISNFLNEDRIEFLNSFALFFSDNKINEAVPYIINLVKSEKHLGYLSTLVYSLEELDFKNHIYEILDFSIFKGYEVFEMTLILFDKVLETNFPKNELLNFIPYLQNLKTKNEEENEYKKYLLNFFLNPEIRH